MYLTNELWKAVIYFEVIVTATTTSCYIGRSNKIISRLTHKPSVFTYLTEHLLTKCIIYSHKELMLLVFRKRQIVNMRNLKWAVVLHLSKPNAVQFNTDGPSGPLKCCASREDYVTQVSQDRTSMLDGGCQPHSAIRVVEGPFVSLCVTFWQMPTWQGQSSRSEKFIPFKGGHGPKRPMIGWTDRNIESHREGHKESFLWTTGNALSYLSLKWIYSTNCMDDLCKVFWLCQRVSLLFGLRVHVHCS